MLAVAVRSFLHCVLLCAPFVAGCSYTEHAGVMANGASSQLYFSGAGPSSGASREILAVGYAAKVDDGRFAMAVVADPVLAPAALGSTLPGIEPSSFDLEVASSGHGTVTLRAAPGAATTLAVDVTPRPSR